MLMAWRSGGVGGFGDSSEFGIGAVCHVACECGEQFARGGVCEAIRDGAFGVHGALAREEPVGADTEAGAECDDELDAGFAAQEVAADVSRGRRVRSAISAKGRSSTTTARRLCSVEACVC